MLHCQAPALEILSKGGFRIARPNLFCMLTLKLWVSDKNILPCDRVFRPSVSFLFTEIKRIRVFGRLEPFHPLAFVVCARLFLPARLGWWLSMV